MLRDFFLLDFQEPMNIMAHLLSVYSNNLQSKHDEMERLAVRDCVKVRLKKFTFALAYHQHSIY